MKRSRKLLSLLLAATMTVSMAATASAAFSDFTDVKGHWAEKTLNQAYSDGILKGSGSKTMSQQQCYHRTSGDNALSGLACDRTR